MCLKILKNLVKGSGGKIILSNVFNVLSLIRHVVGRVGYLVEILMLLQF